MNWEAIGAVGEVVGAIGVILTLIYLASQIRQNSRSLMGQSFDDRTRALREIMIFSHNSEHAAAELKIQQALNTEVPLRQIRASKSEWERAIASFSREDRASFSIVQRLLFDHYQNMFVHHQLNLLDDEHFENMKVAVSLRAPCWVALGFAASRFTESVFTKFVREAANDA